MIHRIRFARLDLNYNGPRTNADDLPGEFLAMPFFKPLSRQSALRPSQLPTTGAAAARLRRDSLIEVVATAMILPPALLSLGLLAQPLAWLTASLLYTVIAALVVYHWASGPLGLANRITLARAVLLVALAGGLVVNGMPDSRPEASSWAWLTMALVALALDGADGWAARRNGLETAFGARFDMELDAFLILVLCIACMVYREIGSWVLLIGAMRYLFVVAGWWQNWLQAPLLDSWRRKAICVWQVLALLMALAPITPLALSQGITLSALLLLLASFARDVAWLHANRRATSLD